MNPHLTDYNESERTDYMIVVASMAGIDGAITSEEVFAIRELCMQFVLGPDARGKVMAAATTPPDDMEDILGRLAGSTLKYSLLLDLAAMAYRDNKLTDSERTEYDRLASALQMPSDHATAILRFAETLFQPGYTPAKAAEEMQKLEQSGVPKAAVNLSASMMALGLRPLEAHR